MATKADRNEQIQMLIAAIDRGEDEALNRLIEAIYPDLKRLAHFQLARERHQHTLNTTAIVHEAFLRISSGDKSWTGRLHFLRAASVVMRHLLVDHARKRETEKHGAGAVVLTLNEEFHQAQADDYLAVLALDSAIKAVEEIDPQLGQIIEYRCFAGLSMQEIADVLGISKRSAEREWRRARGYIAAAMEDRSF